MMSIFELHHSVLQVKVGSHFFFKKRNLSRPLKHQSSIFHIFGTFESEEQKVISIY